MDIDPVMARIVIPSIHVSLPVYHGTDTRTLAEGVGHLFGTSLPIGGPSTHAVLTGHTGLSTATMFDNLTQVKKGDAFYVSSLGQTLKYEVVDIAVVKPEETDSLHKVPGCDLMTLTARPTVSTPTAFWSPASASPWTPRPPRPRRPRPCPHPCRPG